MQRLAASFTLGYHGCERDIGERLLAGEPFVPSANNYDWLGGGIYFWLENPARALSFARTHPGHPVKDAMAIGAIIDLGFCLDLMSETGIEEFATGHAVLVKLLAADGRSLPDNDLVRKKHFGDREVIDFIHQSRKRAGLAPFDTVRGVFVEGASAYPTSAIHLQTHIQICVRATSTIKGVFRVPTDHTNG